MSQINPFADDPLPANAVRLQSAADPLDPYASPPGVNEYQVERDPGVGLWREGKWIIVHLNAEFPARCILTNEPTEIFATQTITWAHLTDLMGKTVKLKYGLTAAQRRRLRLKLTIAVVVSVVGFAAFLFGAMAVWNPEAAVPEWIRPLPLVALFVMGIALKVALDTSNLFGYVSDKKSYVWLSGAGPKFLNSLPAWPGFGG